MSRNTLAALALAAAGLLTAAGPAHAQFYRLPNNNTINGSHYAQSPPGQPGYGFAFPAGSTLYGGPPYSGSVGTFRDRKPIPFDDPIVPADAERVREPLARAGVMAAPGKPRPATLTITLPADALVSVGGDPTFLGGTKRVFVTPRLPPGVPHTLDVAARWRAADGRSVTTSRRVTLTAGEDTKLEIPAPPK